jgi:hypothetical protein
VRNDSGASTLLATGQLAAIMIMAHMCMQLNWPEDNIRPQHCRYARMRIHDAGIIPCALRMMLPQA